jgi:hypothetical protein
MAETDILATRRPTRKSEPRLNARQCAELRHFDCLSRFGRGVVNPYLEHWEAAFQFNSSLFRAFPRLEFSFDPTVHF